MKTRDMQSRRAATWPYSLAHAVAHAVESFSATSAVLRQPEHERGQRACTGLSIGGDGKGDHVP